MPNIDDLESHPPRTISSLAQAPKEEGTKATSKNMLAQEEDYSFYSPKLDLVEMEVPTMVLTTARKERIIKGIKKEMDPEVLQMDRTDTGSTTSKPGAKLPSPNPKEFYWNGKRAKLRPYIQKLYD